MKTIIKIILPTICLLIVSQSLRGQSDSLLKHLRISDQMTTNIIFSQPILSVDLGNQDLIAQKAQGVQNILQIKAASCELDQTNLTVITQDGSLHSFLVSYSDLAEPINLTLQEDEKQWNPLLGIPNVKKVPPFALTKALEWVRNTDLSPLKLSRKADGIDFSLDGIFIQLDKMYFRFRIYNDSHIPYQIDQLRFFLKENKKAKRTAIQEIEITPEFADGEKLRVQEHLQHTLLFVVPSFTLAQGKHLSIELMEVSGGRDLKLKIRNRDILRAIPIPFIQ